MHFHGIGYGCEVHAGVPVEQFLATLLFGDFHRVMQTDQAHAFLHQLAHGLQAIANQ